MLHFAITITPLSPQIPEFQPNTHTHTEINHINHHTKRKTSNNIKMIIATTCYFQSAEHKKFNWLHKSHLRTTDHNSSVPEPRQRLTMLKLYPKAFSRHPKLINHTTTTISDHAIDSYKQLKEKRRARATNNASSNWINPKNKSPASTIQLQI